MLCKLLGCSRAATSRAVTPFGTANLCEEHMEVIASGDWTGDEAKHVMRELNFACRYGPKEDPPLEQDARGAEYAHPRDGSE